MMLDNALALLLGGQTKARVLQVLVTHPEETFHLRGLAKAAGTDAGNTSRVLRGLVDAGLVLASPDSHSVRYAINDRSPLTRPLRQLIASAGSLTSDLRAAAASLEGAAYVALFGSTADGSDDQHSDVDVLVVGPVSSVAAQAAFKAVGRKHQRTVNAVAVAVDALANHLAEGGAFWTAVARGPRVDLAGAWPSELTVTERTAVA